MLNPIKIINVINITALVSEYCSTRICTFSAKFQQRIPSRSNWYCDNGGTPYCNCPEGWTGEHCEIPIDYCNQPATILYDNHMTTVPLCVHGKCHYDQATGSSCECDKCWYGRYCEIANDTCIHVSNRCIGYETPYTQQNKNNPEVVQHICDLRSERCIPNNLDCMFNVPVKMVDGNPVCNTTNNIPCKCKYPVGWCLPLEAGNNIMKYMASKLGRFVDPHFFSPTISPLAISLHPI